MQLAELLREAMQSVTDESAPRGDLRWLGRPGDAVRSGEGVAAIPEDAAERP
jgi:hypothetical protein